MVQKSWRLSNWFLIIIHWFLIAHIHLPNNINFFFTYDKPVYSFLLKSATCLTHWLHKKETSIFNLFKLVKSSYKTKQNDLFNPRYDRVLQSNMKVGQGFDWYKYNYHWPMKEGNTFLLKTFLVLLPAHYNVMIKIKEMKYVKIVLELRDRCVKSNHELKTMQMVQIVL